MTNGINIKDYRKDPNISSTNEYVVGNIETTYWPAGVQPVYGIGDPMWPYEPYHPWTPPKHPDPTDIAKLLKDNTPPDDHRVIVIDSETRRVDILVPGHSESDIEVTIENGSLDVRAMKPARENMSLLIKHVCIRTPIQAYEDVQSAILENGILTIMLKGKRPSPKKVTITKK